MLSDKDDFMIGYYNIEVGRIDQVQEIKGQKIYIPMGGAANINYLAIHKKYQKKRLVPDRSIYLGDYLLRDCEKRILNLSRQIGILFITLCSTEEGYHLYHNRNSYEDFEEDMNIVVNESDKSCYKLYKWVEDIIP